MSEWPVWTEAEERAAAHWLALPRSITTGAEWKARSRFLYANPRWSERNVLARDLRNGDPFHGVPMDVTLEAKRRYQWAESSWFSGYLCASAFLAEAHRFDAAVVSFRTHRKRVIPELYTAAALQRERVRLRKEARIAFVDRQAWTRWAEAFEEHRSKEEAWQQEKAQRRATARQRQLLRQGRETLRAIRLLLRAPARSPLPV